MIIFDRDTKELDIPVGLGNLEVNIVSGSTGAGVSSLDGQTGALTLKTINGNQILGEGDIRTSGSPEEIITSAVTEANAYTDEKIGALVIPTKTSQLINDSGFIGSEGLADYSTTAQTQSAISEAIAAETARTESTYLKEASLDNYATKEWVEGKGYVTSAETANFVTSAQTKEQIEGYHYTTSSETADAISEALGDYYTSAQTDNKISEAIAAETARTESTYLKSASLDAYATKEWVEGKGYVTSADTANFVTSAQTKEQIEGYHYTTSADTAQAISSALTDYYTSGQTNNAISTATQNMVTSTYVNNIWVGTTAQYNAITVKDPNTLYFINDN